MAITNRLFDMRHVTKREEVVTEVITLYQGLILMISFTTMVIGIVSVVILIVRKK